MPTVQYPLTEEQLIAMGKEQLSQTVEPFSSVVLFLHSLPEDKSLPGELANKVLHTVFASDNEMPGLVRILSSDLKEVIRKGDVVQLVNEHSGSAPWQNYTVKKKNRVQFEVDRAEGKLLLKNVQGLNFVELGVEAALQRAVVNPPNLECTLKIGPLPVERSVEIM